MKNPNYWLRKQANRKTGYPIATIGYYGPNDTFASKVAVGIIASAYRREPVALKRWFSDENDVRTNAEINSQILEFIRDHRAVRIAMVERIIGCPHEEGIDYPEGELCPHCLFWHSVDRWTGEKL